jgi:hypothetical protein
MENLIESIKNAVTAGSSDEARAIGAQACRTILVALEARAGEPLKAPTASAAPEIASSPLHAAVSALRGLPPDQLVDLAIARLKAALPPGTEAPQVRRLAVPLVPVGALPLGHERDHAAHRSAAT